MVLLRKYRNNYQNFQEKRIIANKSVIFPLLCQNETQFEAILHNNGAHYEHPEYYCR